MLSSVGTFQGLLNKEFPKITSGFSQAYQTVQLLNYNDKQVNSDLSHFKWKDVQCELAHTLVL